MSKNYSLQRLLIGTHTSDSEQNHLMIAEVRMPLDDAEYSSSSKSDDVGSSSSYGGTAGKIVITQQINHDGEVNRARYMPSNATIIATKTVRVV